MGFQARSRKMNALCSFAAGNDYFNLTYSENPIATNVGGRPPLFQHVVHVASTDRANVNVPRGIVIQNYRPNGLSVMKPIMPGESVGLPRIAVNGSIRPILESAALISPCVIFEMHLVFFAEDASARERAGRRPRPDISFRVAAMVSDGSVRPYDGRLVSKSHRADKQPRPCSPMTCEEPSRLHGLDSWCKKLRHAQSRNSCAAKAVDKVGFLAVHAMQNRRHRHI